MTDKLNVSFEPKSAYAAEEESAPGTKLVEPSHRVTLYFKKPMFVGGDVVNMERDTGYLQLGDFSIFPGMIAITDDPPVSGVPQLKCRLYHLSDVGRIDCEFELDV